MPVWLEAHRGHLNVETRPENIKEEPLPWSMLSNNDGKEEEEGGREEEGKQEEKGKE